MDAIMNTTLKLTKTIAACLGSLAVFGFFCSKQSTRPNIIFIMADDHAAQAISSYGSKINKTPNIDRLANDGLRFDNCFCTNSICAPSRAVILTGKHNHINGVIDNRVEFDGNQQTFPKLLQEAGYQTAMIGKWHLKSDPTGFGYWNILPGQGRYYNPDFIEMGERKRHTGYVTDIITDLCLNWLDQRDRGKPFFLMYHHKAPHRNWMRGPDHLTLYDDETIPEPENLFDDYATRSDAAREQEMTIADHMFPAYDLKLPADPADSTDQQYWLSEYGRMNQEQRNKWISAYEPKNKAFVDYPSQGQELTQFRYQRYIKDYLSCIASIDDNIGRLLDYLDASGLTENTIVVYTSDQGFFLGEHGWYDKRFMYDEALRMPFIVRYPKEIEPGSVSEALVQNLDFAPTFLDFARVKIPSGMQGKSLRPILRGNMPENWRTAAYYHYWEYPAWHMVKKHYGIRTMQFKLLHFYDDIDAWELYDMSNDPHEMNNVYNDPAYADVVNQLEKELSRLMAEYRDTDFLQGEDD